MLNVSRLTSGRVLLRSRSSLLYNAIPPHSRRLSRPVGRKFARASSSSAASRHFSDRTFQSAPISQESKSAISYEFMSDVQAATIDHALEGTDLLVQAKTGTGKTIAFLLPAIERLASAKEIPKGVSVLVLAPTRELVLQIEKEARQLLKHHENISVGHIIGGVRPNLTLKTILQKPPTILISTPGRLYDHLTTAETAAAVQPQFHGLKTLIYDEADRLLDQGFKRELDGILSALPNRQACPRQVLLFSATIGADIREIAKKALSSDHIFVSTLSEDEANTHEHVPQNYIVTPFSKTLPAALRILRQDRLIHANPGVTPYKLLGTPPSNMEDETNAATTPPSKSNTENKTSTTTPPLSKSKVMVFFPTARQVSMAHAVLSSIPGLPPVYQIHSRNSQSQRTKASAQFAKAEEGILLSSDVAARGMDFPGVTLVLQLGLPSEAEQYIHRLGRTARAGESGRGLLVLDPAEQSFVATKQMSALPIRSVSKSPEDPNFVDLTDLTAESTEVSTVLSKLGNSELKAQTYRAWLGYYKTHMKMMRWDSKELVSRANAYAQEAMGWEGEQPPPVETRLVGNLHMKGVPGLNIVQREKPAKDSGRKPHWY